MYITKKEYDTPILITVLGLVMVGMSIHVYIRGKEIIESTTIQENTIRAQSTME